MDNFKYGECKLCFFRGVNNNCYERSYVDGVFVKPNFINVVIQYELGCKKMRLRKINNILNIINE